MQDTGSGGFGFVSIGLPEVAIGVVVLIIVLYVLWKLATMIWAAISG